MDIFFELIQMAIGRRESLSRLPQDRPEWEALYAAVAKHSLLGITFPVIDRLHDETEVPLGVYSRWAMIAMKIAKRNEAQIEQCRSLNERFSAAGFRSCVLKGQSAALRYPDPSRRHSGDIDLWVEGDRRKVVDYLRSVCKLGKIVYHHCDAELVRNMGVEVHFMPSWMNAPLANRRLQRWFDSEADGQFSNFNPELGFCVTTTPFDAVYMLIHIYRHVLEEGIGLRQLLDYYYVLKVLDDGQREKVRADLRKLKLDRFAASVMYLLQQVFCMEDSFCLFPADAREGSFLLDEVLQSGNFGRLDPRNAHEKGEGVVAHGKRKFGRGLRYLAHYPSEVLWMAPFMVWQYFWRRRNGYLYKGR